MKRYSRVAADLERKQDGITVDRSINSGIEKLMNDDHFNEKLNIPYKSDLKDEQLSLDNLFKYLEDSEDFLQAIENHDLVMAIGNTGSGKSTIF